MDRKTARLNLDIVAAKNLTISVSSNYIYNMVTMPMNDNNLYGWMANTIYSPAWTDHHHYFFTDSVSIASVKYSALSKRFLGSIGWTYRPFSDSKLLNGLKTGK